MLAKKYRFKNFDFNVFKNSIRIENEIFELCKIPLKTKEKKFSVVVKTNKVKKATKRNKIRRKIYEIIRTNFDKIENGYYLIIVKENISRWKINLIKEHLFNLLI